jgi:hypothetical protein
MANVVLEKPKVKSSSKRKRIPKELIYEMAHGKPIYYRDYKKVLAKKKSAEEVMGSSFLQGQLVALIVTILMTNLDLRKYAVLTNELGYIYAPKSWRILDIALFEKKNVKSELLSTKYVKTAPKIVIEIDTKADVKDFGDMFSYVSEKTDDLLDSGVEKVLWILTDSQKILIAEQKKQWIIAKWNDTIPVLEDLTINLEQLVNTLVEG